MKKVRNAIVSVATTAVTTPFVTREGGPGEPQQLRGAALGERLTRSVIWYSRSRKPSLPRPAVRSST